MAQQIRTFGLVRDGECVIPIKLPVLGVQLGSAGEMRYGGIPAAATVFKIRDRFLQFEMRLVLLFELGKCSASIVGALRRDGLQVSGDQGGLERSGFARLEILA